MQTDNFTRCETMTADSADIMRYLDGQYAIKVVRIGARATVPEAATGSEP